MLFMWDPFGIRNAFVSLMLLLDRIVYSFVIYIYQVFVYLAKFTIFTTADFRTIADRVYIIVGVVALFLIAFSLLQSLVNPDDLSKGKNSPIKVIKNILISIVLLGVVPILFNFAYEAQDKILDGQVISNIILNGGALGGTRIDCNTGESKGTENLTGKEGLQKVGNYMAVNVFSSFFTGNNDDFYGINIKSEDDNGYSLCQAYEDVKDTGDFSVFDKFVKNTSSDASPENKVNYSMGVSLACGVLTCYLLLTFSIGLAVRAIKLAYYQLISPIPILARIVPQGQKIFDNWLKGTLSTFAEVFIRLIVIFFAILMIQMSVTKIDDILFGSSDAGFFVLLLAKVLLIIGFLIFAKKAPEFITDMVGIKSGSLKLGIKDQIREAALIGKPIATTMDKAQGFIGGGITGGLGGAWAALRHGGNVGSAVRTGAIAGAAKGGNQFGAQRDAAYHRISGEEGADTIWGNYERWSKRQVKDANDAAKKYHQAVISNVENSDDFIQSFMNRINKQLEEPLKDPKTAQAMTDYINSALKKYMDSGEAKNDYIKNRLRDSDYVKNMVNSSDFVNYKNYLKDEYEQQGKNISDEDLTRQALTDMTGYAYDNDANNVAIASKMFNESGREKAASDEFKLQLAEDLGIADPTRKEVIDAYRHDPRYQKYDAAKTYMKDADEREGNKRMADVLKAAIKDNKLDLGGGSKPDAGGDKGDSKK